MHPIAAATAAAAPALPPIRAPSGSVTAPIVGSVVCKAPNKTSSRWDPGDGHSGCASIALRLLVTGRGIVHEAQTGGANTQPEGKPVERLRLPEIQID